jgi:hypothetical protein
MMPGVRVNEKTILRLRIARGLILTLVALSSSGAFADDDLISADRPGIADGSQTLKPGQFQIETGLQREHDRDGGEDTRRLFTPTLLRYGFSDRFELRVESDAYNRVRTTNAGSQTSADGWAPMALGCKIHLFDEDAALHRPSVGIITRFAPPSGSGEFRSSRGAGDLRLAADYDVGKWSFNPNLGVAIGPDDATEKNFAAALLALTAQYNFSSTFNGFVDGAVQAPERRHGSSSAALDCGTAWIVARNTQFDLSVGWRAGGATIPNFFAGAGVSHRF